MITWIQTRFQKHFKWLFIALLIVMVVTFVLTIGNQSFFGSNSSNRFKVRDFYGYNLASEGTKTYIEQAARLSALISPEFSQELGDDSSLERYSKQRAVGLAIARMIGIAEPDEEQLSAYARTKPLFHDQDGKFSATTYKAIMGMLAARQRVPESTILGIMSEDFRIMKVRNLLAGAGFIDPDTLAVDRQSMSTVWTFDLANISFDDFKPEIEAQPEELKKFFDDNQARFEEPEQIQLTQVRFPAISYVGEVPMPSEEQIQATFERNKASFAPAPVQKEDGTTETPEAVLTDAIRASISQNIVQMQALQLAAQAADEYTLTLWREEVQKDSPRIYELAKSMGAQINQIQPYSRNNPPKVADLSFSQLAAQWTLATSERYFSDVISGRDAVSVVIFKNTIDARMPAFEEVTESVKEAYLASRRAELFIEQGAKLQAQLKEAVAKGAQFVDAAKELGLSTEVHEDVSLNNASPELSRNGGPLETVSRMEAGQISPMQMTVKGGFYVFLQNKVVPDFDSVKGTPEELEMVRTSVATSDGWRILGALADKRIAELDAELSAKRDEE